LTFEPAFNLPPSVELPEHPEVSAIDELYIAIQDTWDSRGDPAFNDCSIQ
jgi:hypothetical protein